MQTKTNSITFTNEQYCTLVRMLFHGDWMLNASKSQSENQDHDAQDLMNYIFKQADQFGLEDWVKHFAEHGIKYLTLNPELTLPSKPESSYTYKQGQYLAFIHHYKKLNGRAPAHADMQKYFQCTPPTVNDMLKKLESKGLIGRTPRTARSIYLCINANKLPDLDLIQGVS